MVPAEAHLPVHRYKTCFSLCYSLFPYCPKRTAEKPPASTSCTILREEDTSVSPPLQDQGGRFTVAIPC